jgi:hypothetical protein
LVFEGTIKLIKREAPSQTLLRKREGDKALNILKVRELIESALPKSPPYGGF